MLKLLPKSEIDKAKSDEKAREISEGLKISRRVDALRELQAQEEKALGKFRDESIKVIQGEISLLTTEKDAVEERVKSLSAKLAGMLPEIPIKRKELAEFEKILVTKEEELKARIEKTNIQEIDFAIALRNTQEELRRAQNYREEADSTHKRSVENKEESARVLLHAQKVQENALRFKDNIEQALSNRETRVFERENDCVLREEAAESLAKELNREKIRLADQRATLERELERIKKNRL